MKTKMIALATVAALASAPAFAQSSASQGFDMLTGSLYNSFNAMGIDTSGINDLSLSQVAQIKDVIDGDVSDGSKKSRIKAILAK